MRSDSVTTHFALARATGLEPAAPTLARLCSTPELHPHPPEPVLVWCSRAGSNRDVHVTNHVTINGAQDSRAAAREVERFMWRLESEQRALLSNLAGGHQIASGELLLSRLRSPARLRLLPGLVQNFQMGETYTLTWQGEPTPIITQT